MSTACISPTTHLQVFKNWKLLVNMIDWAAQFPDAKLPAEPDLVNDLMELDMGEFYRKLMGSDPHQRTYGFTPLMATFSSGQIGALNGESFCERVLSAGNLVVDEGNTLLSSEEVEMLTVLRINRKFMQHMRAHYSKEAKQQFKMTTVPEESGAQPE